MMTITLFHSAVLFLVLVSTIKPIVGQITLPGFGDVNANLTGAFGNLTGGLDDLFNGTLTNLTGGGLFDDVLQNLTNTILEYGNYTICNICGDEKLGISLNDETNFTLPEFGDEAIGCGSVYFSGMNGFIPEDNCTAVTEASQAVCTCTADYANVTEIIDDAVDGLLSNITDILANLSSWNGTYPPSLVGSYPNCYICGNEEYNVSQTDTQNISFINSTQIFGCFQLSDAGLNGLIPADVCENVTKAALTLCTCTDSSGMVINNPPPPVTDGTDGDVPTPGGTETDPTSPGMAPTPTAPTDGSTTGGDGGTSPTPPASNNTDGSTGGGGGGGSTASNADMIKTTTALFVLLLLLSSSTMLVII